MKKEIENEFNEWFEEVENYSYRSERFLDDVDYASKIHDYKIMIAWLQSAFEMGYNVGQRLHGEIE
jgi:hypothetical protein